jgi:hypothetical protein
VHYRNIWWLPESAKSPAFVKLCEFGTVAHNFESTSERKISVAKGDAFFKKTHRLCVTTHRHTLFEKLFSILDLQTLIVTKKA